MSTPKICNQTEISSCWANGVALAAPDQPRPDIVDPKPSRWEVLYTQSSWAHLLHEKFGDVGRSLAPLLFAKLDERDAYPGDGVLDVSRLSADDIDSVFSKIHGTTDEVRDVVETVGNRLGNFRKKIIQNLWLVRMNNRWWAMQETGQIYSLSGDHLETALATVSPRNRPIRMVLDRRNFSRRIDNSLNPDRRGIWSEVTHRASLAVSGANAVYSPEIDINILPFGQSIDPGMIDVSIMAVSGIVTMLAALAGRRSGIHNPVVMREKRMPDGRFFRAPKPVVDAFEVVQRSGIPTEIIYCAQTGLPVPGNYPRIIDLPEWVRNIRLDHMLPGRDINRDGVRARIMLQGLYVQDSRNPESPREGFVMQHAGQVVFAPLEVVRESMRTGKSITFMNRVAGVEAAHWQVIPVRNVYPRSAQPPARNATDPNLQITGFSVKPLTDSRPSNSMPWMDVWQDGSPMTTNPENGPWARGLLPRFDGSGWRYGYDLRMNAAISLLSRVPKLNTFTNQQRDGLRLMGYALMDGRLGIGSFAQYAQIVAFGGRPAIQQLGDRIMELLPPVSWKPDHVCDTVYSPLNGTGVKLIERALDDVHQIFPSVSHHPTLAPIDPRHQNSLDIPAFMRRQP